MRRDQGRRWQMWFWLLAAVSLASLGGLSLIPTQFSSSTFLEVPVNLHSILRSDYSQDARPAQILPVSVDIVEEVIRDQSPDPTNAVQRVATVWSNLTAPVPTVTRLPGAVAATATSLPASTDTATPLPPPTDTEPPPETPTQEPTPTVTPAPTRTIVASPTVMPTGSPTPSQEPNPPTAEPPTLIPPDPSTPIPP